MDGMKEALERLREAVEKIGLTFDDNNMKISREYDIERDCIFYKATYRADDDTVFVFPWVEGKNDNNTAD
jgi:hypothetical protein